MTAAIPLNITAQLQAYASASVPLDNVESLRTLLIEAPSNFLEPTHIIQINGQLLNMDLEEQLSIHTAAGCVSLKLSLPSHDQLDALKTLLATPLKSRTNVTLLIQPKEPDQATLLVPKGEKLNILLSSVETDNTTMAKPSQNFEQGGKLTLTVLPDKIEKSILREETKTQPLLSKSSEQLVEKSFSSLQKIIETFLQKTDTTKQNFLQETASTKSTPALQQGQEFQATIDRVITHLREETVLSPNQIEATVIGKSHSHHILLSTGEKTLFVKQEGSLPTGTTMILTLDSQEQTQERLSLPREQDWPALREFVGALQQNDPELAMRFLQTKLPSPTQNMSGTTLFFMAALQAGKVNEWLGLPVHMSMIKDNKRELIDQLLTDINEVTQTSAQDTRAGEWKALPLPLHFGQEFDMLRLYVRDQNSHAPQMKNQEQKKHSHFVISMNMSHLGAVQLEGFSRPQRLDLILRSERQLPTELPRSIRSSYTRAMEAIGLSGTLIFQTGTADWVRIETESNKKVALV